MGEDAQQRGPMFIVVAHIMVRSSFFKPGMYEFESTEVISVMDGYVEPDLRFLMH